jgi:hypothetical protein
VDWRQYQVDVPEGVSGNCRVKRFTVSADEAKFSQLRAAVNPREAGREVEEGEYTGLWVNSQLMMSDTPAEIADHRDPIIHGKGHCLVNGLGLGVVANALLMKDEVNRVTVIEINPHVIELVELVWKARYGDRLEIVEADAMTYLPPEGVHCGYVWHDIWPTICVDNLPDMRYLHRKYERRCDRQGSWCWNECTYRS